VKDLIFFLLVGLGLGALYAMLGSGLVVVYRGSGVINFAHGAFAMYGMFTFDEARRNGQLRLPWIDFLPTHWLNVPVSIKLSDHGVPTPVAFTLAIAMAVLLGLVAHFLVFRPLRNAAALGKVVASVGVMLYLQGVAQLNFGGGGRQAASIVPDSAVENFLGLGKTYPEGAIWAVGISVLMGVTLWVIFKYTRFGLATRGAAGNEKGAVLLGYSPQFLAAMNWVIASVVATAAAIVVGPIQGSITPVGLSALVVGALGAALIGGLRSIMIAMWGGLALGAVQSLIGLYSSRSWFPAFLRSGARDVVPLAVIVLVLFLRGKSLPQRGSLEEKRLPLSPRPVRLPQHTAIWAVVVIGAAFLFQNSGSRTVFAFALSTSLIAAILMLSMVVVTGYVGQISLAQMSLAGIAAFFMARMMANGSTTASNPFPVGGPGLPWPVAAVLGIIAAVVVGVLIGLPAVRIRGVQLAVVTVAAAISLQTLYFENQSATDLSAGAPANVKPASFFGISLASLGDKGLTDRPSFAIFVLIVLILCAFAVSNLRRNGTGRRFLAVRANERAAAAAGINVARTKLLAFGIGAGIAGIGGVMLAFKQNDVSSANFVYQASLAYLAFAYLGGITSVNGAIVGGLLAPAGVITATSNYFLRGTSIDRYVTVIGGAALVFTAIGNPNGIAPAFQELVRHVGNWLRTARATEWTALLRRVGPVLVVGIVVGYLIWPLRVDSYSKVWMPLLGGYIALLLRALVLAVRKSLRVAREKRERRSRPVAARRAAAVAGPPLTLDTARLSAESSRAAFARETV
jgi:branched-chain amino acid transport system permease protein